MSLILLHNSILSVIVTSITFAVVFLLNYLHKRKAITTEVSRKVVHIGAGTLYLALRFYNDQGYFSKYLNICPNLLWTGILIWKSQNHSSSNRQKYDLVIGTMTRNNRGNELLRGPLFFNLVMIVCGTALYKTVLGALIMAILTWGDGLAAVVGVRYGSQRKIYGTKTFDGSMTFFLIGILASIIYISILIDFQSLNMLKIVLTSLLAAVIETITPSDFDNLTIPLSIFMLEPLEYILKQKRLILASGSPQRKQLLQSIGLNFDIIVSEFAEDLDLSTYKQNLDKYVIDTAEHKCRHVYEQMKLDENEKKKLIIIGADTMCSLDHVVYGKPTDREDAFRMIKTFSNNTHQVCTGVCILQGDLTMKTFSETTDVTFGPIDDETIQAYIETDEPMNKAGGYGIQALGATLVKKIDGDYFNVVGFPIYHFCTQLKGLLDPQIK